MFLREVFSENGTGSFARIASAFTVPAAIFCLIYLTYHNKQAPDILTISALGAFGVFPYGTGKAASTISNLNAGSQPVAK